MLNSRATTLNKNGQFFKKNLFPIEKFWFTFYNVMQAFRTFAVKRVDSIFYFLKLKMIIISVVSSSQCRCSGLD